MSYYGNDSQYSSILSKKQQEMGDLSELIKNTIEYTTKTISSLNPYIELNSRLKTLQSLVEKCYEDKTSTKSEFIQCSSSIKDLCKALQDIAKSFTESKHKS